MSIAAKLRALATEIENDGDSVKPKSKPVKAHDIETMNDDKHDKKLLVESLKRI